jgi:integrase
MGEIRFYLNKSKGTPKSRPIMTSYHFNGQRLFYYTGKRIAETLFNPNAKESYAKSGCPDQMVINETLRILRRDIGTIENEFRGKELTPEILRQELDKRFKTRKPDTERMTLLKYFDSYITAIPFRTNKKGHKLSPALAIKYTTIKNLFVDFCTHEKHEYDFNDIDSNFLEKFNSYMMDEKKYATNTIGRTTRFVKTILNDAAENGFNTSIAYRKLLKGVEEESESIYLNTDELQKIYDLDLSDRKGLDRVRDLFLIGCWTGLRFSDYSTISPDDIQGDRIRVLTQKTKKKVVIPLNSVIKSILLKYDYKLPKSISNQKFNAALKDIGKLAEINQTIIQHITKAGQTVTNPKTKSDLISSHVARRSFATNHYKMGIESLLIMGITGHKTEREFMKYIRIDDEEKADMFETSVNNKSNNIIT